MFFETSAKTGSNVDALFRSIGMNMLNSYFTRFQTCLTYHSSSSGGGNAQHAVPVLFILSHVD